MVAPDTAMLVSTTMRTPLLLVALLPIALCAQTTYFVEVGGSSLGPTLPYYDPNVLNIQVGDIVTWENASGTHNVNGTSFFFPENPEGFTNGDPSDDDWTYSYTFAIPGVYEYMCTTEGHSATQMGRIIVADANSVQEGVAEAPLVLSPSLAADHIYVEVGNRTIARYEVVGLDGRVVISQAGATGRMARITVAALPKGNYLVRVVEANGNSTTLRFSKS
jgi:plastocyanin